MQTHGLGHAATVQFKRTMEAGWRDTNHGLVHGCNFQQPAAAPTTTSDGEKRAAPAKIQASAANVTLTTLLSAPLPPAKPQQAAPLRQRPLNTNSCSLVSSCSLGGSGRAAEWRTEGVPRTALRDRVASTRTLPENLRAECLERLERIDQEIPLKLRHRPADLQDSLETDDCKANRSILEEDEGDCDLDISSELDRLPEPAVSMAAEIPALQLPLTSANAAAPVARSGLARPSRQRRKRQVWAVENYDLTTAASVWSTSTKSSSFPGKISAMKTGQVSQRLLSAQSAPVLRISDPLTPPALGTERTRRAIEEMKAHMANSKSTSETGIVQTDSAESASPPAARGVKSLLRTTLRFALQG